jgi:hypothetical protein
MVIYLYLFRELRFPKLRLDYFKDPKLIILGFILLFSAFLVFLPHFTNNYYLPFHVDEWEHYCYTRAFIESGTSSFTNPYTGTGISQSLELGFHYISSTILWTSGVSINSIFLFMPSFIAIFIGLTVFNIGERSLRKFGLEGAFIVSFIPTTCRMMGPSFFVPLALGLLFLTFILWLNQIRKIKAIIIIPFFIWCTFIIHPPTALACLIVVLLYSLLLFTEKEKKIATMTFLISLIPVATIFLLTTRWNYSLQQVIDAFFGGKYISELNLPNIWPTFEHLGLITWIFFIIGAYFSIKKGKTIHRTVILSAIAFILLIGLYDKMRYGIPIMYERSFMYLFLMVTIAAGFGLSEIRKVLIKNKEKIRLKEFKILKNNIGIIFTILISVILIIMAVPAHQNIPYYKMIEEEDYETFLWIRENIDSFRDENNSFERAAVDPFYTSPFSAVTGIFTISNKMSPLYGYELHSEMEMFLNSKCIDTSFLNRYELSIVYGNCINSNLTLVYPNVYLYYN